MGWSTNPVGAGYPQSPPKALPAATRLLLIGCREEFLSETSQPDLGSGVHEYSTRVTTSSKPKGCECRSLRLRRAKRAEGGRGEATVVVVPLGCGCFYAVR